MITKKELSTKTGYSIPTIDRYMKKGMPYIKVVRAVRFDLGDVEKWLKENSRG